MPKMEKHIPEMKTFKVLKKRISGKYSQYAITLPTKFVEGHGIDRIHIVANDMLLGLPTATIGKKLNRKKLLREFKAYLDVLGIGGE